MYREEHNMESTKLKLECSNKNNIIVSFIIWIV